MATVGYTARAMTGQGDPWPASLRERVAEATGVALAKEGAPDVTLVPGEPSVSLLIRLGPP